jgi:hypothetical protein
VTPADESRDHGVLFARAYLDSKLAKLKEDQQAYLVETVKEWFDKTDNSSSKAYVASFVGPVLDVLGHVRGELGENLLTLYSDRSHQKAVALCYVVAPDKSLDQTSKGRNYAVSLIIALRKIGLKWGILTNGLLWRLYCVKEKAPFETYFQVDLGEALRTRDSKQIFLLAEFFSATAFLPSETGRSRLDDNRHESDEETREIEKHLESKIESILGKICMGFIESEGKNSYTEEGKRIIFSNSAYLLYRILFVLYAEARGLLPLQNPEYHEKSMENLMNIAKENHSKGIADPHSKVIWNTLCELFNWINQGNRALGIPPYNGGLFDDGEKPYLANHAINDAYLSEAMFSLGFREERDNVAKIDYNDLSVRPLGSLYEGILEYQLFIAPERMVRRKEKSVYKYIPEQLGGKVTRTDIVIEKGDIYFSQSSEERKLTGSYYTPENVVRYIVENSLGRHLAGAKKEFQALINKVTEARVTAIDDKERRRIERFIDTEILSFLEKKVLSIRILDPAMGSGHFLVNAAYFLANYIVESLYTTEWENDSVDTSSLLWRRRIVEKCIFGVDLNGLATELAKLSLWLITADRNKPLTFMDHHLRTGNSLLGTNLGDLRALPDGEKVSEGAQTTLDYPVFEKNFVPKVLRMFDEMEASSERIEEIERKKTMFKEWEDARRSLQRVADSWLATYFGYKIEEAEYQQLLKLSMEGKDVSADSKLEEIVNMPKNRYFHWWIEFPEAFYRSSEKNNMNGFDVIIGNPPYIRNRELGRDEKKYMESNFVAATGQYDIYQLFIEKGISLLKEGGLLGFITSNKYTIASYGEKLRQLILDSCQILSITDVSNIRVFKTASTYPYIIILEKELDENVRNGTDTQVVRVKAEEELTNAGPQKIRQMEFVKAVGHVFDISTNKEHFSIIRKMQESSLKLGDIVTIKETVHTGNIREKLVVDSKLNETCRMLLRGRDCQRYYYEWKNLWIVVDRRIIDKLKGEYATIPDDLYFRQPKLFLREIADRVTCCYDEEGYYSLNKAYVINQKDRDYSLKFILGLLNSKLLSWFFRVKFESVHVRGGYLQFKKQYVSQLPIKKVPAAKQELLVKLVDKMLSTCKRMNRNGDKILEENLKKTDAEIDEMVYEIYGITSAERKTIEESLESNSPLCSR